MNSIDKEKLNALTLHGGIHTLSVVGNYTSKNKYKGTDILQEKVNRKTGEVDTIVKINPNTFACNNDTYISTLKEFRAVMRSIQKSCLKDFTISRIDFRIDNYENEYTDFLKINKIVIILLSQKLGLPQLWQSYSPLSLQDKTIRSQGRCYEVEYYDRHDKTQKQGLTHSRLELRNKALNIKTKEIPSLINGWCNALKTLTAGYEELQTSYNVKLLQLWKQENQNKATVNYFEFVKNYQENICTSKQLQELLLQMGAKTPKNLAYKYTHMANIEMISQKDLETYINKVIKTLKRFRGKC